MLALFLVLKMPEFMLGFFVPTSHDCLRQKVILQHTASANPTSLRTQLHKIQPQIQRAR